MKPSKPPRRPAPAPTLSPPTREQIAALAHAIWIDRGCPSGSDLDHWLEAERTLTRGETRVKAAADDIPADPANPDPSSDPAIEGRIKPILDQTFAAPDRRSPTSL